MISSVASSWLYIYPSQLQYTLCQALINKEIAIGSWHKTCNMMHAQFTSKSWKKIYTKQRDCAGKQQNDNFKS